MIFYLQIVGCSIKRFDVNSLRDLMALGLLLQVVK